MLVVTVWDLPASDWLCWPVALLLNAAAKLCHAVWPLQYEANNMGRLSNGHAQEPATVKQEMVESPLTSAPEPIVNLHEHCILLMLCI